MGLDGEQPGGENRRQVRPVSPPLPVAVFNVVVYVRSAGGSVEARVANLPGISAAAASEPLALKSVISESKRRLAAWQGSGEAIPWIDPVPQPAADESERLVAVHL